jgi:hypothetical protein
MKTVETFIRLSQIFYRCRVCIIILALCEYIDTVMLYFTILEIKLKKVEESKIISILLEYN